MQRNQDFHRAVSQGFKLRPLAWWMMVWGPLKLQPAGNRDFHLAVLPTPHKDLNQGRGAVLHSKLSCQKFQKSLVFPITFNNGEADDQPDFFPAPPLSLRPRRRLLFYSSSDQSNPRRCWCYWQHHKWPWCCSGPQLSCGRLPFLM